jgi:PAS domain S-box-containing protein
VATPAHNPIAWHRRFEARVLLAVTLVAGVSLLTVLAATNRVVTNYSLQRSNDDLRDTRAAFDRLVDSRAQFAAKQTRLVVELPMFRVPLTNPSVAADAPTIDNMAEDYCRKLDARFCVVTDAGGSWIGRTAGARERDSSPALTRAIASAKAGHSAREIATLDDGLFLIISEPAAFAEEVLGTLTAAYHLNDAEARALALVTHCDVSFVCADGRLCASSLPSGPRADLAAMLDANRSTVGVVDATLRELGGISYVGGVYPLRAGGDVDRKATLVLLQDWTPTERALARIRSVLLGVGLLSFGIAIAGTLAFSRRMTRPLRDLAVVAKSVAAGDWAGRVPVEGPAEARTMAETFNQMTVTLRHWHEEAKIRAEELYDSYQRFRSVTDSANDAIISVNGRGEIVFWNPRAHAVFGYEEREAIGQSVMFLVPPRDQHAYAEEFANLLSGHSPWIGNMVELHGRRKDGSDVPLELSLSTWKTGHDVFYTGVIRDITDRRQAAAMLRQRDDELRHAQKMEAVGRLAGGIAHDFNNLLTAIVGYAELVLEKLPADDDRRGNVQEIEKAGRSAAALTRELLAFSRKQVLQPVVLSINDVVRETENLMRRLVGEDVEVVLDLAPDLALVRADRSQIEQVLLNLAANARDAMPDGGCLTIGTQATDGVTGHAAAPCLTGQHVVMTVRDKGQGMTPQVRARVFEPFFTTKDAGKGTGLGLSTVYGIVTQSGGQVWVESELGHGATFYVALPVTDAPAKPAGPAIVRLEVPQRGSETVLLVEDNAAVRSLATEALTRYGYRVLQAENGQDALRVAADRLDEISIVVTDLVMPIMGGRELATRLRARRRSLKIIFTSGHASDPSAREGLNQPWATFIRKPFTPAVLGKTVREVLDATQGDPVP